MAVGRSELGPTWVASHEAGALRVTSALLGGERTTASQLDSARRSICDLLDGLDAPRPDSALAVGGTARAVAKILGPRFGARKLDVTRERAETLLGGTLVLAELARRLDVKLEVGRGGVREGAALAFAREQSAAA